MFFVLIIKLCKYFKIFTRFKPHYCISCRPHAEAMSCQHILSQHSYMVCPKQQNKSFLLTSSQLASSHTNSRINLQMKGGLQCFSVSKRHPVDQGKIYYINNEMLCIRSCHRQPKRNVYEPCVFNVDLQTTACRSDCLGSWRPSRNEATVNPNLLSVNCSFCSEFNLHFDAILCLGVMLRLITQPSQELVKHCVFLIFAVLPRVRRFIRLLFQYCRDLAGNSSPLAQLRIKSGNSQPGIEWSKPGTKPNI